LGVADRSLWRPDCLQFAVVPLHDIHLSTLVLVVLVHLVSPTGGRRSRWQGHSACCFTKSIWIIVSTGFFKNVKDEIGPTKICHRMPRSWVRVIAFSIFVYELVEARGIRLIDVYLGEINVKYTVG